MESGSTTCSVDGIELGETADAVSNWWLAVQAYGVVSQAKTFHMANGKLFSGSICRLTFAFEIAL